MPPRPFRVFAFAIGVSMTFLAPLAPLVAVAQLARPAVDPNFATQMERLTRGANGYTGPLTLSPQPITVAPAPVAYEGTSTTYSSTFSTVVKLVGSVKQEGANLLHE